MLDQENGLIEVILVLRYVSISYFKISFLIFTLVVIQDFSISKINSTAVRADWGSVTGANHFTVYYQSTSRNVKKMTASFPGNSTEGIIKGLDPILDYLFSISVSLLINGNFYEGERSQLIRLGKANTMIFSFPLFPCLFFFQVDLILL